MPRSIFLSFVYEDKTRADQVKRWADAGLLGRDYVVIDEARDVRQQGDAEIWRHLRSRIQGAAVVLCLVGRDTHNHDWVRKELAVAASEHKQVLLMHVPDTHGPAPEGFRHLPLLSFDPSSLCAALAAYW